MNRGSAQVGTAANFEARIAARQLHDMQASCFCPIDKFASGKTRRPGTLPLVLKDMVLVVTLAERRARTLARQAVSVGLEQTIFADRRRISADGGIASGLALAPDLVADPKKLTVEVFSRGLLRPEGIATG